MVLDDNPTLEIAMSHPLPNLRRFVSRSAKRHACCGSDARRCMSASAGEIQAQRDGGRQYITAAELQRYIASKARLAEPRRSRQR
jgi:hypothetical protein